MKKKYLILSIVIFLIAGCSRPYSAKRTGFIESQLENRTGKMTRRDTILMPVSTCTATTTKLQPEDVIALENAKITDF